MEWASVRIPKSVKERIENFKEQNRELGYSSISSFLVTATDLLIQKHLEDKKLLNDLKITDIGKFNVIDAFNDIKEMKDTINSIQVKLQVIENSNFLHLVNTLYKQKGVMFENEK
ncbi:MAG: hypothetical protein AB1782_10730 [Cyanobacteriota bacterium]